jgi:hypothetical protein
LVPKELDHRPNGQLNYRARNVRPPLIIPYRIDQS